MNSSLAHPPIAAGIVLDGRYLVTDIISRSGLTLVVRAQDLSDGSDDPAEVALKLPHAEHEANPAFLRRFEEEERILRFLPGPETRSRPYLVTEYVRGWTLGHLLAAMSPFPENDTLRIGAQICVALQYLRDLNAAISPEAERIVLRALSRAPGKRHASARALGLELTRALEPGARDQPTSGEAPPLR